ncbi:hypothetical protein PENSPDRAFT_479530 [Peniophora sp. CONT]|nr:hypothetical protein PENSPDRAFT_479530 [Peniophora sp. CONT]
MSHIYGCPVELLQAIFADACFDDPPTACALRLVDRRMSAVCSPLRFTDISVSGEKQLQALLYGLDAAIPSDVRIQRLFVCDRVAAEADEEFDVIQSGCTYEPEEEDHNSEVKHRNRESAARLEGTLAGILRHAAPHVQSLCFLSFNPEFAGMLDCFTGFHFPLLTSLALRCVPEARVGRLHWGSTMPVLRALTFRLPDCLEYTMTTEGHRSAALARAGELTEFISSLASGSELTSGFSQPAISTPLLPAVFC